MCSGPNRCRVSQPVVSGVFAENVSGVGYLGSRFGITNAICFLDSRTSGFDAMLGLLNNWFGEPLLGVLAGLLITYIAWSQLRHPAPRRYYRQREREPRE